MKWIYNNKFLFLLLSIFLFSSCQSEQGIIMTVSGPISVSEMGVTLEHEHILVDFIGADSTGAHRWEKQAVVARALPFLQELKSLGCQTFVDCTPVYLGRDPEILRQLADQTGLHIITNTGLYGARNNQYIPARAYNMSAEALAKEWIAEFNVGIENTGIKPGFIKISVDPDETLSPMHKKLIQAAALTHLETGLTILSHTGPDQPAFNQLDILKEMSVPADAFIWTHAQAGTIDGWIEAAKIGAWISLDNINIENITGRVKNLHDMKTAGLLNRVLISHDSGWYSVGEANGGDYNGYSTIFKGFIPALRKAGFTNGEIEMLLVDNPAKAFKIKI